MIRKYHNHKPVASRGRAYQQSQDTRKTNEAKQPALFPFKMIVKLVLTQSNAQQNIEQKQNPTMEVTINNKSTPTEPPPSNRQQPKPMMWVGAGL